MLRPEQFLVLGRRAPDGRADALTADLAFNVLTGTTTDPGDPPAAPEPSTWAMMLVGFAGLSFAYWRARCVRTAGAA